MMPPNETDDKAEEWFNGHLEYLRYGQDYSICFGHSKKLMNEDGSQKGIAIRRPYIRIFSTGITKIYRMTVLGEKLEKVVYTEEEEKELETKMEAAEQRHEKQN